MWSISWSGVVLHALPRRRAKFPNGWALAVESTARIVACEKQRGCAAIEQEREATGHVVLCKTCRDIQSRLVIAMPRRAKAKHTMQDDLFGGDEESAAESGEEATTVSSDTDQVSGSEAEAESAEKKATTRLSARQEMATSLGLQMFNAMQPSKVVLAVYNVGPCLVAGPGCSLQ